MNGHNITSGQEYFSCQQCAQHNHAKYGTTLQVYNVSTKQIIDKEIRYNTIQGNSISKPKPKIHHTREEDAIDVN